MTSAPVCCGHGLDIIIVSNRMKEKITKNYSCSGGRTKPPLLFVVAGLISILALVIVWLLDWRHDLRSDWCRSGLLGVALLGVADLRYQGWRIDRHPCRLHWHPVHRGVDVDVGMINFSC